MKIRTASGDIVDLVGYRAAYPETLFPETIDADTVAANGDFVVTEVEQPTVTTYQYLDYAVVNTAAEGQPATWTEQWTVQTLDSTAEETLKTQLQDSVWELIRLERERRLNDVGVPLTVDIAGVPTEKGFSTDLASRTRYLQMHSDAKELLASGSPATTVLTTPNGNDIQWKTEDNSLVTLTIQIMLDLVSAIANQEQVVFFNAEFHRLTMLSLADPTGYDYSTGWPPVYAGAV